MSSCGCAVRDDELQCGKTRDPELLSLIVCQIKEAYAQPTTKGRPLHRRSSAISAAAAGGGAAGGSALDRRRGSSFDDVVPALYAGRGFLGLTCMDLVISLYSGNMAFKAMFLGEDARGRLLEQYVVRS